MVTLLTVGLAFLALLLLPILQMLGIPAALIGFARIIGFPILGYIALTMAGLPLWGAAAIALTPVILFLLGRVYFAYVGRKALKGGYGEGKMWVAELVQAEDKEFMHAMNQLTQMDAEEIMVIADSKQELKELTIERAQE